MISPGRPRNGGSPWLMKFIFILVMVLKWQVASYGWLSDHEDAAAA